MVEIRLSGWNKHYDFLRKQTLEHMESDDFVEDVITLPPYMTGQAPLRP